MNERLLEITQKLADKKQAEQIAKENIKKKYKALDKKKNLTIEQRVARLEEILSISIEGG